MEELTFNKSGDLSSIGEEDLNPKCNITIDPPPADGRCEVCGRHITELEPFGGSGAVNRDLLGRNWRHMGPYDAKAERAWAEYQKENSPLAKIEQPIAGEVSRAECDQVEDPLQWFVNKFGDEEGQRLFWSVEAYAFICASWECRDCFLLGDDEYLEKIKQRPQERGEYTQP